MTDLLDQVALDLPAAFFPTGGDGFAIDLTPTGGSAVRCIFDDNSAEGSERGGPTALIQTGDLGTITHGTGLTIDSRAFKVEGIRPVPPGDTLELVLTEVT